MDLLTFAAHEATHPIRNSYMGFDGCANRRSWRIYMRANRRTVHITTCATPPAARRITSATAAAAAAPENIACVCTHCSCKSA
jgi:hypothetical protein